VNAPNDLTAREQRAIRATLHVLRLRIGGTWKPLAKVLRYQADSLSKVAAGGTAVTPTLALRLARHVGVSMDALLAGEWLPPGTCPHCGHGPEDFNDEEATTP
jgi:hypothetical protein